MDDKFTKMTEGKVSSLILRLSAPTVVSMLITTIYNMADTFFAGHLPENSVSATGAVGVVFSLMAVIQAIGFFFGQGSGNFISRCLGHRSRGPAEIMATVGVVSSFSFGLVFSLLGLIFLEPLAVLLGSTETILPLAKDYLRIILIACPFMTASFTLNNQLRFQGSAFYAMIGISAGGILNMLLDPLFMFVFKMGLTGAALATAVSQFISFILLFIGTFRGENIRLGFKNFRPSVSFYKEIFRGGFPSLCRQAIASVAMIFLNNTAGIYGDCAISAFSVVSRIVHFGTSVIIGIGQGFQPVCGFNFGAKKYGRVKEAFYFTVKLGLAISLAISVPMFIFSDKLVPLFQNDPQVVELGSTILKAQIATFALSPWVVISNMMMQNLSRVFSASFLGLARQGLFLIPAVLLLNYFFGLSGLLYCVAVADVLSLIISVPMQIHLLKSLNRDE